MKIQLLAAAALAVFTAGPVAVTASSLRGAVTDTDSEDLGLALEDATDYPKVDVYSDYAFDPEEEDADLDLNFDEDGEDMDLISYWHSRTSAANRIQRYRQMRRNGNWQRADRLGRRITRNRQWQGRFRYRNYFNNRRFRNFDNRRFRNFDNRRFRKFDRYWDPRYRYYPYAA